MELFLPIFGLLCAAIFAVRVIIMIRGIPVLLKAQQLLLEETIASLKKRGFNADGIIKINLPGSRFYLDPKWIPADFCFLFVDDNRKKWTIVYDQSVKPKIYDYKDFRDIDIELNGKPPGNMGLNIFLGSLIGHIAGSPFGSVVHTFDGIFHHYTSTGSMVGSVLGATLAAGLTRRYGLIKQMNIKIRVNSLNDQYITLPIIDAPLRGLSDKDKGLEFVMGFVADLDKAFLYISENS
jgi:hypothetical protein